MLCFVVCDVHDVDVDGGEVEKGSFSYEKEPVDLYQDLNAAACFLLSFRAVDFHWPC